MHCSAGAPTNDACFDVCCAANFLVGVRCHTARINTAIVVFFHVDVTAQTDCANSPIKRASQIDRGNKVIPAHPALGPAGAVVAASVQGPILVDLRCLSDVR